MTNAVTKEKKKRINEEFEKTKHDPELRKKYNAKRKGWKDGQVVNLLQSANIELSKLGSGVCGSNGCTTILSIYNKTYFCSRHEGRISVMGIEETLRRKGAAQILSKVKRTARHEAYSINGGSK